MRPKYMQNCQLITIKYLKRTRFPIIHYIKNSQPNEYKKPPLVVGKRPSGNTDPVEALPVEVFAGQKPKRQFVAY